MELHEKNKGKKKGLKAVKQFSHVYNSYKPDEGIIIEFLDNNGYHRVLLGRGTARKLAKTLEDAEFDWHFHEEMSPMCNSTEES